MALPPDKPHRGSTLLLLIMTFISTISMKGLLANSLEPNQPIRFESHILPIFQAKYLVCHGQTVWEAKLDLRTQKGLLRGGVSGPSIIPGSAEQSLLFEKVASGEMPLGQNQLSPNELETIRLWIEQGALREGQNPQVLPAGSKARITSQDVLMPILHVRCLMARRLVERGVRFVQLYIEQQIWDQHTNLESGLRYACDKTDKPIHGLLTDLKRRGLLDSTLVVWGGEFGRLPLSQNPNKAVGRDHGPSGFSVWLAGGGIKGGTIYGATDELGHKAIENPVNVHDFHATILYLLGINH